MPVPVPFGQLTCEVLKTRGIAFYPQSLEKGERSQRALKLAMLKMYVQGVSTRRIEPIAKGLCGFELSSTPSIKSRKAFR